MKKGLTELVFILDRSGSMSGLEADTIGRVPLRQMDAMTEKDYSVRGCTALLDAMGGAIRHIGNVHKYARNEDRPEKTLFVITTDGQENSSHNYSYAKVKKMVERQKSKYGWEFLFLGANMDAITEAAKFGIAPDRAVRYKSDHKGTLLNYAVLDETITAYRANACIAPACFRRIEEDCAERR